MSALLSTLQELPDDELLPLARRSAIGALSGGLAHDAGNALFGILGLLDLATAGTPVDAERLRLLRASASELDTLLRPLLHFARGEPLHGRGDLAAAAREALALYRHADRKDIDLDLQIPDGVVPVACPPAHLLQAVVHVLLAATPGGALRIALDGTRLRVSPVGGAASIDTVAAARIAGNAGGELVHEGDALVLGLPSA